MRNEEFDSLLFKFSQCNEKDIDAVRTSIILQILDEKTRSKRIDQILRFIRAYIPRDERRNQSKEFMNMVSMYFSAVEFEDKIMLRDQVVSYIANSSSSRKLVNDILEVARTDGTQTKTIDCIRLLSRLKTEVTLMAKDMLDQTVFADPDAYIIAYAAGLADGGIVWRLAHAQHGPVREAAVELLARDDRPKAGEELRRIARSDGDKYIKKLAADFLGEDT